MAKALEYEKPQSEYVLGYSVGFPDPLQLVLQFCLIFHDEKVEAKIKFVWSLCLSYFPIFLPLILLLIIHGCTFFE